MIVVVTSFSNREDAERVSNILVVERLAACVHILAPHLAVYEWKGEIRREEEVNILIKTDDRLYSVVEERLKELHPYEIPLIFRPASRLHVRRVCGVGQSANGGIIRGLYS
jgi:periplasmic divalent cation tolerance protein